MKIYGRLLLLASLTSSLYSAEHGVQGRYTVYDCEDHIGERTFKNRYDVNDWRNRDWYHGYPNVENHGYPVRFWPMNVYNPEYTNACRKNLSVLSHPQVRIPFVPETSRFKQDRITYPNHKFYVSKMNDPLPALFYQNNRHLSNYHTDLDKYLFYPENYSFRKDYYVIDRNIYFNWGLYENYLPLNMRQFNSSPDSGINNNGGVYQYDGYPLFRPYETKLDAIDNITWSGYMKIPGDFRPAISIKPYVEFSPWVTRTALGREIPVYVKITDTQTGEAFERTFIDIPNQEFCDKGDFDFSRSITLNGQNGGDIEYKDRHGKEITVFNNITQEGFKRASCVSPYLGGKYNQRNPRTASLKRDRFYKIEFKMTIRSNGITDGYKKQGSPYLKFFVSLSSKELMPVPQEWLYTKKPYTWYFLDSDITVNKDLLDDKETDEEKKNQIKRIQTCVVLDTGSRDGKLDINERDEIWVQPRSFNDYFQNESEYEKEDDGIFHKKLDKEVIDALRKKNEIVKCENGIYDPNNDKCDYYDNPIRVSFYRTWADKYVGRSPRSSFGTTNQMPYFQVPYIVTPEHAQKYSIDEARRTKKPTYVELPNGNAGYVQCGISVPVTKKFFQGEGRKALRLTLEQNYHAKKEKFYYELPNDGFCVDDREGKIVPHCQKTYEPLNWSKDPTIPTRDDWTLYADEVRKQSVGVTNHEEKVVINNCAAPVMNSFRVVEKSVIEAHRGDFRTIWQSPLKTKIAGKTDGQNSSKLGYEYCVIAGDSAAPDAGALRESKNIFVTFSSLKPSANGTETWQCDANVTVPDRSRANIPVWQPNGGISNTGLNLRTDPNNLEAACFTVRNEETIKMLTKTGFFTVYEKPTTRDLSTERRRKLYEAKSHGFVSSNSSFAIRPAGFYMSFKETKDGKVDKKAQEIKPDEISDFTNKDKLDYDKFNPLKVKTEINGVGNLDQLSPVSRPKISSYLTSGKTYRPYVRVAVIDYKDKDPNKPYWKLENIPYNSTLKVKNAEEKGYRFFTPGLLAQTADLMCEVKSDLALNELKFTNGTANTEGLSLSYDDTVKFLISLNDEDFSKIAYEDYEILSRNKNLNQTQYEVIKHRLKDPAIKALFEANFAKQRKDSGTTISYDPNKQYDKDELAKLISDDKTNFDTMNFFKDQISKNGLNCLSYTDNMDIVRAVSGYENKNSLNSVPKSLLDKTVSCEIDVVNPNYAHYLPIFNVKIDKIFQAPGSSTAYFTNLAQSSSAIKYKENLQTAKAQIRLEPINAKGEPVKNFTDLCYARDVRFTTQFVGDSNAKIKDSKDENFKSYLKAKQDSKYPNLDLLSKNNLTEADKSKLLSSKIKFDENATYYFDKLRAESERLCVNSKGVYPCYTEFRSQYEDEDLVNKDTKDNITKPSRKDKNDARVYLLTKYSKDPNEAKDWSDWKFNDDFNNQVSIRASSGFFKKESRVADSQANLIKVNTGVNPAILIGFNFDRKANEPQNPVRIFPRDFIVSKLYIYPEFNDITLKPEDKDLKIIKRVPLSPMLDAVNNNGAVTNYATYESFDKQRSAKFIFGRLYVPDFVGVSPIKGSSYYASYCSLGNICKDEFNLDESVPGLGNWYINKDHKFTDDLGSTYESPDGITALMNGNNLTSSKTSIKNGKEYLEFTRKTGSTKDVQNYKVGVEIPSFLVYDEFDPNPNIGINLKKTYFNVQFLPLNSDWIGAGSTFDNQGDAGIVLDKYKESGTEPIKTNKRIGW